MESDLNTIKGRIGRKKGRYELVWRVRFEQMFVGIFDWSKREVWCYSDAEISRAVMETEKVKVRNVSYTRFRTLEPIK